MIPNKYSQLRNVTNPVGEGLTSRSKYHYAEIVKVNLRKGLYTIKYFPPWDKKGPWITELQSQKNMVYREEHNINNIDLVSNMVSF